VSFLLCESFVDMREPREPSYTAASRFLTDRLTAASP
jgi:hypothetical protein